ncbi:hypothetical protein ACFRU3_38915 [Streptomyces sp. NPDC056910]|uniref:hypothetical protein n=1 Tax=Streptomyces sp. NPDC056910 TaxID=3345964 RepID=UPI0036ACC7FB
MTADQEPAEEPGKREPVDLSRFHSSAFKPLTDYYTNWAAGISKQLSETAAARLDIPRVMFVPPVVRANPVAEMLGKQLADLTGFNAMIRQAMEPLNQYYRDQWQGIFASLANLREQIFPENLRDAAPTLEVMEMLLIDEGIPLMWVPGPKVVRALLDAPDAAARRRVIGQRWKGITNDCEGILEGIDHPRLQDARGFGLDVVRALRDGHTNAAQALAANLLDSLMQRHFDKASRVQLTKNEFKTKGIKFNLDDYKIRMALTFAPVWYAHARYFPTDGDPIPRVFGRHPSAHGVSRAQYTRTNAIYGLMLVVSVLKFFDLEMTRR